MRGVWETSICSFRAALFSLMLMFHGMQFSLYVFDIALVFCRILLTNSTDKFYDLKYSITKPYKCKLNTSLHY